MSAPCLTIDPSRGFGRVCVAGRGLHAESVATAVWAEGGDVDGTSWVYEVEPDDSPTEVEDSILSGESFRCSGARIIRRFTVSNAQKSLRRRYIPFVVPP